MHTPAARTDLSPPPSFSMHGLMLGKIDPTDRAGRVRDMLLRLAADPNLTVRTAISAIATAAGACNLSAAEMARFVGSMPKNGALLRSHLVERAAMARNHFAPETRRTFDAAEVATILGVPADDALAAEIRAGAALVRGRVVAVLRPGGIGHMSLWTVMHAAALPDVRGAEATSAFREMIRWTFRNLPVSALGIHIPADNRAACALAVAIGFRRHATTEQHGHFLLSRSPA